MRYRSVTDIAIQTEIYHNQPQPKGVPFYQRVRVAWAPASRWFIDV